MRSVTHILSIPFLRDTLVFCFVELVICAWSKRPSAPLLSTVLEEMQELVEVGGWLGWLREEGNFNWSTIVV